MTEIVFNINCPHCGAPLSIKAGSIVIICEYCNSTIEISDKPFVLKHSIVTCHFTNEEAEKKFIAWIKGSDLLGFMEKHGIKIGRTELKLVPFWIGKASVKYSYEGLMLKYGNKIEKKDSETLTYMWKVLARREGTFPARDYEIPEEALAQYGIATVPKNAEFFNVEITEDEAKELGKTEIVEYQKAVVKKDVDEITNFSCDVSFAQLQLVHVPIYFITYNYKNREYSAYLDGGEGEMIHIELPSDDSSLL